MEKQMKDLELKTPDLGDSEKIQLVKWYSKIGMIVQVGDEVLELETDKAAFPIESPVKGILTQILVLEGASVKKDQILGILQTFD